MTTPVAPDSVHAGEKPSRYVALLFIVSTVSLMDRQILAILLEQGHEVAHRTEVWLESSTG